MTITLNDEVEEDRFLDPRDHQISRQWIIILCETVKEKVYRTKMNTRWMLMQRFETYLTQFAVAKPGHTVYFLIQELRKAVVRCLQLLYLWHMEMWKRRLETALGNVKTLYKTAGSFLRNQPRGKLEKSSNNGQRWTS